MAGFGMGRRRHTVKRVKHQMRDMNGTLSAVVTMLNNAGFNIRKIEDLPDVIDDVLEEIAALRAGDVGQAYDDPQDLPGLVDGGLGPEVTAPDTGFMGLGVPDSTPEVAAPMGLGVPGVQTAQTTSGPPDPKAVQAKLAERLKVIEERGVQYRSFGARGRTTVTREEELARTGEIPNSVIAHQVAALSRRIPR